MLGNSASPNAAVAVAAGGNLVLASTMTVGSVGYTLPGYDLVMLADDNASFQVVSAGSIVGLSASATICSTVAFRSAASIAMSRTTLPTGPAARQIDGGFGFDQMYGDDGNGTYYVNNAADKIFENVAGDEDVVFS